MKRAKRVNNYTIHLLEAEAVGEPQETVYKYLGIVEPDSIQNEKMKDWSER